jgi:pilus assembly protein CpaC
MRFFKATLSVCGLTMLATTLLLAQATNSTNPTTTPPATQQAAPANGGQQASPEQTLPTGSGQQSTTVPGPSASNAQSPEQGPAPLRVMVGKSLLINTTERLKRVSVTDPNVADAIVVTPTQILVHGRAPGEISLLIWDEAERSRSFDLRVDVDVTACAEEVHRIFPEEQINVTPSRAAIVLSGHVSTEDVAKRAGLIADAYSKTVVNVLTFGPVGSQEILLEVKFAEVDRSWLTQYGLNIFSTGAGNSIGLLQTQQFGSTNTFNLTDVKPHAPGLPGTTTFPNLDPLNLFLFRPDLHLGATLRALEQKNLLQILAEPNLIAVNGKEASFLAGGEFPFPVVQPGAGFTAVSIQFRQFGVVLKFTPVIMPNGNIHLKVAPEVSQLDFSNALTISGFVIPALSTRKAETELEMQDGQTFVIAGLMDNRVTNINEKIPGLGNLPIIGNLFKSKNNQKNHSELMVLVTARRISPSTSAPPLPKNPKPYLDKEKFDGGSKSTGGK